MNQLIKYNEVLKKVFCTAEEPVEKMSYRKTEGWNSIGHMMLMTELETVFGIKLSTQDIMKLHNYGEGIEILRKHGIDL